MHSRYVLITGASRGIGAATARRFAREGYPLVLNGFHSPEKLEALCRELTEAHHIQCMATIGDAGDSRYVDRLFDELEQKHIELEILVNNTGISRIGLFQDMSVEEWDELLRTNLTSCFLFCRKAIPMLLRHGSGSIVNVSSVWGNTGASCEAAYSATKGGIAALTKALGRELAPSHIRCNAVALGTIDTDMNRFLSAGDRAALEEEIPCGRFAAPSEAADLIYDLAVNHPYLTAQVVTLDGGWT